MGIQRKSGICVDCPAESAEKYILAKRCIVGPYFHYQKYRTKQAVSRGTNRIKSIGYDQAEWYEEKMSVSTPVCMNCGLRADWLLRPNYKKLWKSCQAHILPKRKTMFPSVATHPDNHLVLFSAMTGICNCHDRYDLSWLNAATLEVFPIAKERFRLFKDDIAEIEKGKIPIQFLC